MDELITQLQGRIEFLERNVVLLSKELFELQGDFYAEALKKSDEGVHDSPAS